MRSQATSPEFRRADLDGARVLDVVPYVGPPPTQPSKHPLALLHKEWYKNRTLRA